MSASEKEQAVPHLCAVVAILGLLIFAIVIAGHTWWGKVFIVVKLLKETEDMCSSKIHAF